MENKIAVIYKSKYGATKRYAGWIALKLDADLYEVSDIRRKDLKAYDTIIYGGPLYIEKIKGIKFIINNYEYIKDKKIICIYGRYERIWWGLYKFYFRR